MNQSTHGATPAGAPPPSERRFFGHPRGLATLFMTEFFERFSYYGMRALLVLFLVAATDAANPGFGIDRETAGAVYGLYTGAVFLGSLPGGWIADRLIGQRRAVFWGGIIIAIGNFILAIPATPPVFYLGLATIVVGVGLLKPNISAIVGALYEGQPGARRDAGFSIFYMGINLGALLAPLVAGTIGEAWNWRSGFFVAGLAMLIGVAQYKATEKYLGEAGAPPQDVSAAEQRSGWRMVWIGCAIIVVLGALIFSGVIPVTITGLAQAFATGMLVLGFVFFAYVLLIAKLQPGERGRVATIAVFFLCAALFWAGFEQAATSFNLFAQDFTDRSMLGGMFPEGVHPASWYQSANPIFVVLFAPFFAWVWVSLGARNLDPSAPVKFGLALLLLAAGFGVIMWAAQLVANSGSQVAPTWLLLTYLLHTFGELCLSPVGLSNVTKLAPKRFVGQMMGTWFLGAAVGNTIAGLIGGHVSASDASALPGQFLQMIMIAGAAAVLLLLLSPIIRKWMGDAR
ncbi:MAG: peptide MFS transporter [Sinobacteraceae bacterium]|nr:peptide MFS transporter [Nevskiaceae bacterium]MCP5338623.1 peptide MFS transporter [Nevskiaceae bacterium]MCP5466698.1 peptide MFS transporter [Nevskiaceae bacterium]